VSRRLQKSILAMDTMVHLTVVTEEPEEPVLAAIQRALTAFHAVERVCSRFQADSELSQLTRQVGSPVQVTPLLFEALRFAWAMAESTDGAFDPTVGRQLEAHGFNRHYLTGEVRNADFDPATPVSYRDVTLDQQARTVCLHKPLVIDLGAVAKGLAIDLAAGELAAYAGFVVDAGGDIYAGGCTEQDEPWRVGIRHPLRTAETFCTLHVTDGAVCTSGGYERTSRVQAGTHHLIDPRSGRSRLDMLSCTVVAPHAMLADAMSTAAFILGRNDGLAQVEAAGLHGLCIDADLQLHTTSEMARYLH
jgi:thiamine biosynthesis lipoprotein